MILVRSLEEIDTNTHQNVERKLIRRFAAIVIRQHMPSILKCYFINLETQVSLYVCNSTNL